MDLSSKLFMIMLVYSFFSVILYTINVFFRTREGILFVHIPLLFLIISLVLTLPDGPFNFTIEADPDLPLVPEFSLSYIRMGFYSFFWLFSIINTLYPSILKLKYGLYHWIFLSIILFSASSITVLYGSILFILSLMPYAVSGYMTVHAKMTARNETMKRTLLNTKTVNMSNRGEVFIILLFIVALMIMIVMQIIHVWY